MEEMQGMILYLSKTLAKSARSCIGFYGQTISSIFKSSVSGF